ncbi:CoA-binding protein [Tamaricihabitans halophyticus]|nr:CoA-binding protein [Tamaricihabitans halophyticus]
MSDNSEALLDRVVRGARTIAVVGASDNPSRPSYEIASYLHDQGFRIFPVNPKLDGLLGLPSYRALADVPERIDIVDVFRTPSATPEIAEQAVAVGAGALWLQLGVINEQAAAIAARGGLDVVMDRCLLVEHRRLAAKES